MASWAVRRRTAAQRPLYEMSDHGHPIAVRQQDFAPPSRSGSWGTFAESFLRFNEKALRELDVAASLVPGRPEPTIHLVPGGRTGAIPLRSAQSGNPIAGLIVRPRFGWPGVGQVMSETGWAASPSFLELPLVPGSARQIPPWVLAGPVLFRLSALLDSIVPGYTVKEETRASPRGRIVWPRYLNESLARGAWHHVPCRFPDLSSDPELRSAIRWALERVRGDLVKVSRQEPVGLSLVLLATRLLDALKDVEPRKPQSERLQRIQGGRALMNQTLLLGIQALGWIADERGLGGGQEMDGLAWQLSLDILWERYVEATIRNEVKREGGEVRVGRLGETVFPVNWTSKTPRSVSKLVPDLVVHRGAAVRIVDAKYKAHYADLDEQSWARITDDVREAHRADIHQVLAYASLYDAEQITATLIYPLRRSTWEALHARNRDRAVASLFHGKRNVQLELRGLPFGGRH